MWRFLRPLLAIAVFASASFARAEAVRLAAPAAGTTLRGGSFAELRWTASQLPSGTEEWEAFLSIDGGKYYAFRVTPHLDIRLRRFTFVVPNVDTRNARILIRTGNEVEETHFEMPAAFSIVRDAQAEETIPRLLHFGRGESAREGDPAVVSWTEGTRDGFNVTQLASTTIPLPEWTPLQPVAEEAPAILSVSHGSEPTASLQAERPLSRDPHAVENERLPITADLLLVCRRRNI